MKILKLSFIPVVLLMVFIASCSDDNVSNGTGGNILIIDPTVTRTDEFGNELGGDTTDWCSSSNTLFRFNAAYPNPTNDTVNFRFQLPEQDTINLMYQNANGDTVVFIRDQVLTAGVYTTQFSGNQHLLNFGVFRFMIHSKRFPSGGDYCRYYGDVQFY